ncbi:MAG: cobyric acid synthase [Rhodospirillales bacterium]|nr:cobyric acid synthase [Rhodospirillales bacterium]
MFQGTGSDVGKSLIVAGLCRAYVRRGLKVRPFKPQNMSNNAAVTDDGGEIGRAQALQALAAKVPPSVHMNPVLLKPQSDIGAQVIVQGQVFGTAMARDYHKLKPQLLARVLDSFRIIGNDADLVIVEGAGSPAEVNLRAGDIANMGFAEAADVPVILVADINRGGVIASLIGTYEVLSAAERARIKGYIINKFRGDVSLFDDGLGVISAHTGWPCCGVIPHFEEAHLLPQEDAMALDQKAGDTTGRPLRIAVPRLPRIANFDDLDPLRAEPDVSVELIEAGLPIPAGVDVILLPGSKATCSDLAFVKAQGWDIDIQAHHRQGGWVVGLCGGYQMLGTEVSDPEAIEGTVDRIGGLGLLDVKTIIHGAKALHKVSGHEARTLAAVHGYEMHMGETTGSATDRPWFILDGGRADGASSTDGRVLGSYLHGLFADDGFRTGFLNQLRDLQMPRQAYAQKIETILDNLAQHMEHHLRFDLIDKIAHSPTIAY